MSNSSTPSSKHLLALVKQLESEIALSHERTSLILSNLPVGLLLLKDDQTIDVTNRLIESIFGYSRKQLFGKHISFLYPDLELNASVSNLERFACRANGEKFPTQLTVTSVPTPDGERLFVFVVDISERYKMEKLKRDFISMISHDLRTPLMNASGVLELSAAGKYGELPLTCAEQLLKADKNLERVIKMISSLLEVEKLEDEHIIIDPKVNNLTVTVKEAVFDVSTLAQEKQIEIEAWQESLFAKYDLEKIHRVIVNLLSNAIKFSPKQSKITISHTNSSDWIEVAVSDEGKGVPDEKKESIFGKYSQVDRDDETKQGGFGLGLAICRSIIDSHGGAVGVRNNKDQGSVFWFTLPNVDE